MKNIVKSLIVAGGLAMFAMPGANAALVCGPTSCTDSDSFTNIVTELVGQSLRVDKYEVISGKTLDRVLVELSATLTSSGDVTNNAAGAETFSVFTQALQFDGTVAGGIVALPGSYDAITPFSVIHSENYDGLAGGGTTAAFGPGGTTEDTDILDSVLAGITSQFIDKNGAGTDQFGYDFSTLIGTTITGGGGNQATNLITKASATLTVTYEFSDTPVEVPETATLAVMGFGLLGLGAAQARRRRDRKAA